MSRGRLVWSCAATLVIVILIAIVLYSQRRNVGDYSGVSPCLIAENSFIPVPKQTLLAIPKQEDSSEKIVWRPAHRVGEFIIGSDNIQLDHTGCESANAWTIVPSSLAVGDRVPTIEKPSDIRLGSNIQIALSQDEADTHGHKLDFNGKASETFLLENPRTVDLALSTAEFLHRLVTVSNENGILYIIHSALVADLTLSGNSNVSISSFLKDGKAEFDADYRGLGALLGVKLMKIEKGRWFLDSADKARIGEFNSDPFSRLFADLTTRPFDPETKFYQLRNRAGVWYADIFPPPSLPGATDSYVLDSSGERLDNIADAASIPLNPGRNRFTFYSAGANSLFAHHIDVEVPNDSGDTEPFVYDGSYAALMRWQPITAQDVTAYRDELRIGAIIDKLHLAFENYADTLTKPIPPDELSFDNATIGSVGSLAYDPTAKVGEEIYAALRNALNEAQALDPGSLTQSQAEVVRAATRLSNFHQRLDSPALSLLEQESIQLAYRAQSLEVGYLAAATSQILKGVNGWKSPWELLNRAANNAQYQANLAIENGASPSKIIQRQQYYSALAIKTLYQSWQQIAFSQNQLSSPESDPDNCGNNEFENKIANQIRVASQNTVALITKDSEYILDWSGDVFFPGDPPLPWQETVYFPPLGLSVAGSNWSRTPYENGAQIELQTNRASFALVRFFELDVAKFSKLSWQWTAEVLPVDGNLLDDSKDDQVLQLLIGFIDVDDNEHYINYVWDTTSPENTTTTRCLGQGTSRVPVKYFVVQSGERLDGQKLISEQRNFSEDVKLLYGAEIIPHRIMGVAVQANSQWTESSSKGSFGRIIFSR